MQRLAASVFALLCVLALPAAAREDAALGVIDACAARLDAEIDVGYARLAARCPELPATLRASAWARWLPLAWTDADNNLSAQSLAALHALVVSELALKAPTAGPEVARLRPILAQLAATADERPGWWTRLQNWLRRVLAKRAPGAPESAFARLFGRVSLSQAVLEIVSFVSVALVVALAGFIVVNEWRAAGLHVPWVRGKRREAAPEREGMRLSSWHDIERAATAERPRMLLELLAARLTATRRLPASAALTVRELTRAAQLATEDHSRLLEVALAAERLRYSDHRAAPGALAAVIERGRELLERLSASSMAAP
jgi:hypothetical protein